MALELANSVIMTPYSVLLILVLVFCLAWLNIYTLFSWLTGAASRPWGGSEAWEEEGSEIGSNTTAKQTEAIVTWRGFWHETWGHSTCWVSAAKDTFWRSQATSQTVVWQNCIGEQLCTSCAYCIEEGYRLINQLIVKNLHLLIKFCVVNFQLINCSVHVAICSCTCLSACLPGTWNCLTLNSVLVLWCFVEVTTDSVLSRIYQVLKQ